MEKVCAGCAADPEFFGKAESFKISLPDGREDFIILCEDCLTKDEWPLLPLDPTTGERWTMV